MIVWTSTEPEPDRPRYAINAADAAELVDRAPITADLILDRLIPLYPSPVRAGDGEPAIMLAPPPGDTARDVRATCELLIRAIGPAKIGRPIRCYEERRPGWTLLYRLRRRPRVSTWTTLKA